MWKFPKKNYINILWNTQVSLSLFWGWKNFQNTLGIWELFSVILFVFFLGSVEYNWYSPTEIYERNQFEGNVTLEYRYVYMLIKIVKLKTWLVKFHDHRRFSISLCTFVAHRYKWRYFLYPTASRLPAFNGGAPMVKMSTCLSWYKIVLLSFRVALILFASVWKYVCLLWT